MGTERVIVMRTVYDEFLTVLKKEAESFKGTGSAVTIASAERARSLVQLAVEQGARLECGRPVVEGASLQPTILTGVTQDMDLFYTESFGPTISLMAVDSVDEAVNLANNTSYGLATAIFSRNIPRAIKMARRIKTGARHINAMTVHDEPNLPHGGVKDSGYGRFGAQWGTDEFLQIKTITVLDGGV